VERLTRDLQALKSELAALRDERLKTGQRVRRGLLAAVVALTVVGATAGAQNVNDVLFVFAADTPARASDVNFNFNLLKVWLEQKVGTAGSSTVTINGPMNITGPVTMPSTATATFSGGVVSKGLTLEADGEIQVHTTSVGSDGTARFGTVLSSVGTAITRATPATAGDTFTINETGLYAITVNVPNDWANCAASGVTVAKNTVTTVPTWSDPRNLLVVAHYDNISYDRIAGSNLVNLVKNDVVRVFASGCSSVRFEIKRVR
jgi:hypothetical protein